MKRRLALGLLISMILICILFSRLNVLSIRAVPMVIVVPDDYSAIQEAINDAADGDTISVKSGTYYEHVVVNKTVSLVGEDAATTIIDANDTGHAVHVTRNNVTIAGFTVCNSGHGRMPDLDAGICLNSTTGCVVSENRVIDNGFAGIEVLYSQYNTLAGNNVSGSGWGGIHMMGSSRNTVSGNILGSNGLVGINGHVAAYYNNITGNVIFNSTYGMFYNDARYNFICRNNISDISVEGIELQETVSNNVVAENNLVNCTTAIHSEGPNTNNTMSANFITGAMYGIRTLNAQSSQITNNTIVDNNAGSDPWRAGIRLEGSSYSQIRYNNISGNYYGVLLYSSSPYVLVYGNSISNNEFGLRVASGGSSYLNATKNVVTNNIGYGIGLTGFSSSSNYAVLIDNTIADNGQGISIGQYSDYNIVSRNTVTQNDCGLYIEYSTGNSAYGNNFVSNGQQASIQSGSVSNWNSSYPSGGNYWSDYNGTDLSSGLYQNETGSDGIGDTACVIDANNVDHYPLKGMFFDHAATSEYHVQTICNSTLSDFQFNGTAMRFNASGESGTAGFCRVCIPAALMNETYHVFVSGTEVPSNLLRCSNATHSYLYFNYTHPTQEVVIVPEFPSSLNPLFPIMAATMLAAIGCRRKRRSEFAP